MKMNLMNLRNRNSGDSRIRFVKTQTGAGETPVIHKFRLVKARSGRRTNTPENILQ